MLTTILLDAGGVLLDETEHEEAWARAISDALGMPVASYWTDVDEAVACFVPRVYRYVLWKHTRPDRARFERLWTDCLAAQQEIRPPLAVMPGIGDEIRALRGRLRIGIAGQYGARLLDGLEDAGLAELLDWRFTQDDFDRTKPDPRYFVDIANACGVSPSECIEVGDRIDKDVIPARQAGMKTIRIRTGVHRRQEPRLPEEIPDVELPSVEGLAAAALDLVRRQS